MQSLTALIRDTRADDPLARPLEAILDSGLIIFSRDSEGHFVQLSEVLSERAGIVAGTGASQPRNLRVFDDQGQLLPGSEYPAAITRRTGNAQREVLRRLVSEDDREIWLKMSTLPLERGPEGWSVLTVATDVTELQQARLDAEAAATANEQLLALSLKVAAGELDAEGAVTALADVLADLLPKRNLTLAMHDGPAGFVTRPLVHGYGQPMSTSRGGYSPQHRSRWTATTAHVNRDVQDTDIYGSSVVVEFPNEVRSIVIAPCMKDAEQRVGALVAMSDRAGDFTDGHVRILELAARIVALAAPESHSLSQAS